MRVAEEDFLAQRDGRSTEEGAISRWGFPTPLRLANAKKHLRLVAVFIIYSFVLRRETSHPPIPHYGGAAGGRPDKTRRRRFLHATSFSHEVRRRNVLQFASSLSLKT